MSGVTGFLAGVFLAECLIAFGLHLRWFQVRRSIRDARKQRGENGTLSVLADVFVHAEFFRMAINAVLLLIAVGVLLVGGRALYLILLVPAFSITASMIWLRSLDF